MCTREAPARALREGVLPGLVAVVVGAMSLLCAASRAAPDAAAASATARADAIQPPRLGQPLSAAEAARYDLNVFPDGTGLPAGRGRPDEGARLFQTHCAMCHGAGGRGASAEELAGGTEPLTSPTPDKTIGLYWPYATTLFDFIRRAKPMQSPGSLSNDEVYALTAYLLFANGVIAQPAVMDAKTLPRVRMPNRDGFIGIDAQALR